MGQGGGRLGRWGGLRMTPRVKRVITDTSIYTVFAAECYSLQFVKKYSDFVILICAGMNMGDHKIRKH